MPAYNVAWCVGRAVDSVLAQSFREREADRRQRRQHRRHRRRARPLRGRDPGHRSGQPRHVRCAQRGNPRGPRAARRVSRRRRLVASRQARTPGRADAGAARDRLLLDAARVENPGRRVAQPVALPPREHRTCCRRCSPKMPRSPAAAPPSWCARSCSTGWACSTSSLRGFEDPDLWMRLAAVSGYACIDEPLVVVMRRENSVSRNLDAMRKAALAIDAQEPAAAARPTCAGSFWRNCLAGVYTDYAKGRLPGRARRRGHRGHAARARAVADGPRPALPRTAQGHSAGASDL